MLEFINEKNATNGIDSKVKQFVKICILHANDSDRIFGAIYTKETQLRTMQSNIMNMLNKEKRINTTYPIDLYKIKIESDQLVVIRLKSGLPEYELLRVG